MHRALIEEVRARHAPERLFTLWPAARGETACERFGREVALRWERAADELLEHLSSLEHPAPSPWREGSDSPPEARGRRGRKRAAGAHSFTTNASHRSRSGGAAGERARGRSASLAAGTVSRSRRQDSRGEPSPSARVEERRETPDASPARDRGPRKTAVDSREASTGVARKGRMTDAGRGGSRARRTKEDGLPPAPHAPRILSPADAARSSGRRGASSTEGVIQAAGLDLDATAASVVARSERNEGRPRAAFERATRRMERPTPERESASAPQLLRGSRAVADAGGEPPRLELPRLGDLEAALAFRAKLDQGLDEHERRAGALREWRRMGF